MATVKESWGGDTSITITLNSLASSATVGRASTAVDNSTNLYLDAHLVGTIVLAAGAPANDQAVYVYGYADDGRGTYTESITGTDAGHTIQSPTVLPLIGVVPTPTNGGTYPFGPWSVAAAFGGVLPYKWGICVVNFSGQALAGSSNVASYNGLAITVA